MSEFAQVKALFIICFILLCVGIPLMIALMSSVISRLKGWATKKPALARKEDSAATSSWKETIPYPRNKIAINEGWLHYI